MYLPIFFAVISVISAQVLVPGIEIGPVRRSVATPFAVPACTKIGGECLADCKTLMACSAIGSQPVSTSVCSGTTPYCNNNACSATRVPNNEFCDGKSSATFECTAAGIFPDPASCTQYYNCPAASLNAVLFQCPTGAIFDSKVQSCVVSNQRMSRTVNLVRTCTVTNCPRNFVGNVAYKSDPSYYIYCMGNNPPLVFKCPDPDNQIFDPKQSATECSYKCTAIGHFTDRLDCTRFNTCTRRGLGFKADRNTCPSLYWFNNGRCERQGETPCVPEIPATA